MWRMWGRQSQSPRAEWHAVNDSICSWWHHWRLTCSSKARWINRFLWVGKGNSQDRAGCCLQVSKPSTRSLGADTRIFYNIYIYISISQDSLYLQNYDYGRKVIWNLLQQTSRVLFITISGLLTLIAWGRWVTQTLWPQRILGEWNKLFKGLSNEEAAPSRFCSHHFGMISPEFWLRMDETGSLTYEYLSLSLSTYSKCFKLQICSYALENCSTFDGTFGGGSPVVTCRHIVMSPCPGPQAGGRRATRNRFFSGDTNSTGPGGQVPQVQNFGSAQVAMCLMIRASYESWAGTITRRPMTSTHYSEENPKLGNPACWATCRPQEQWTTRWGLHHNLPQLPYPRTPASKLHACGSVMMIN